MVILVISDSHGAKNAIRDAINKVGKIDMLIHCGDICGDQDYLYEYTDRPLHVVAGNCDYFCNLNSEELFEVQGKKIFVTHGHGYFVSLGIGELKNRAKQLGAEVVCFGHTHKPIIVEEDGIVFMNPGSVAFPRQEDKKTSYGIITIDSENKFNFSIDYLA